MSTSQCSVPTYRKSISERIDNMLDDLINKIETPTYSTLD